MANNNFNLSYNNPDLVSWAQAVNARNDAKAKQSRENMMNTLKMLGIAGAAFNGNNNAALGQEATNYYEDNWSEYSPEDQVALNSLGFNPSLYNNMNKEIIVPEFGQTNNSAMIWG